MEIFHDKQATVMFLHQQLNLNTKPNQKSNFKTGNRYRHLCDRNLMRDLWTKETSKLIEAKLFNCLNFMQLHINKQTQYFFQLFIIL